MGGNIHPLGRSGAVARPEAVTDDDSQASTVVGRLEAILASFDGCDQALGVSEISHRIGLPKSTVHRLANQLCAVGWLERNSGGYRVGLKLLELGSVALQRTGLREAAFKHLHSLAQRTGLTVHLGILDHGEVVYLDRVTTTRVSCCRPGWAAVSPPTAPPSARSCSRSRTPPARRRRWRRRCGGPSSPSSSRARCSPRWTTPGRPASPTTGKRPTAASAASRPPSACGDRAIGAVSVTGPITRMRAHSLVHEVRNTALAIWSPDVVPLPRPLASAR